MRDDDLRTRAEQHLQDGEGDHILIIAQLLAALDAAEQRALREQWIEPLEQSDDPEIAEAVRVTPDYVLMTRAASDGEHALWQQRVAEAERRAFEAGFVAGRQPLVHPDVEPLVRETADAAYRTYQQAKESPESDARTTNQQTRQG